METPDGAVQVLRDIKRHSVERGSTIYCGAECYPLPSYRVTLGSEMGEEELDTQNYFPYAPRDIHRTVWAAFSAAAILRQTARNVTCEATERNYSLSLTIPCMLISRLTLMCCRLFMGRIFLVEFFGKIEMGIKYLNVNS